jgi:hypothetical protein
MSGIDDIMASGPSWSNTQSLAGDEVQDAMIFGDRIVRTYQVGGVEIQPKPRWEA